MQMSTNSGPYHFNDPDHLLIGRGVLSQQEEATQFALWAISKAPLMITANLTTLSFASQTILSNEMLIAVNQDRLGQQANCTYNCDYNTASTDTIQSFQAQIEEADTGGAYVVVVAVNWDDELPHDLSYDLQANGISFYPWDNCEVVDLYDGTTKKTNGGIQAWGTIAAHGNLAKKVKCLPF